MLDCWPNPKPPQVIVSSVKEINDYIGIDLSAEEMTDILTRLHFGVEEKDGVLTVTVPDFRLDLEGMPDLAEKWPAYTASPISRTPRRGAPSSRAPCRRKRPWS